MQKVFATSKGLIGLIENIEIHRINVSKYSYRINTDEDIDELSNSINEKGLLQPILVRINKRGYTIVAGNRRYRACKKLGWKKILCHVVELDDKEAFEVSLVENIQAKRLDPLEEGKAFKTYVTEYGWGGITDLSEKISKSPSYINKRIKLLGLPGDILNLISQSVISTSIGEELLYVKDKDQKDKIMDLIQQRKITIRDIRRQKKEGSLESDLEFSDYDTFHSTMIELDERTNKAFDKAIITLRIAQNKLASIIEDIEDNWLIYEILMQHKNQLNTQIDTLIKEKKKI